MFSRLAALLGKHISEIQLGGTAQIPFMRTSINDKTL